MCITFDQRKQIFSLHTKHSTYQMQVGPFGFLLHLYYGRKSEGFMDYLPVQADRGFSGNPYDAGTDRTFSLDILPQELPCRGTGDYRSPALAVTNADGSFSCDLRYQGHEIRKGKYNLPSLPAVYAGEAEAETLSITMKDPVNGLCAELLYGVLPEPDIITRSIRLYNEGTETVCLNKVSSACLDFVCGSYDLISFYGRHTMERNVQRHPLLHGTQVIDSRRGMSSHQHNPMLILASRETTETWGSCYSMSLVYSGSFQGEAVLDQMNQTRLLLGLSPDMFTYPLAPGESFYAPEVILSYSGHGLEALSHNLHDCIRGHICRGSYKTAPRPILLNSWESVYFDFDGDKLTELAKEAAELGMDMLVMDDGWFGERNDDTSGLGDWTVNIEKLGLPLGSLIDRVHELGLKFGIWIEPECINEDSRLYQTHKDWVLQIPGRNPVRARGQLVLDFSRRDVVDGIFSLICRVLDQGTVDYIKWDMNRGLLDVFSSGTCCQGKVLYDYMLGLYDFLERLQARYPDTLIEGCSGGGGRFDAGMLYYTPQIWCSDNTDPIDRVRIQYGTSFGYPLSAMAAHVSAVPNHQTGRVTSLNTRCVAAMTGAFGYELDPGKLSESEKAEIRKQLALYRHLEPLFHEGRYYRLTDPFTDPVAAWESISPDGSWLLVSAVRLQIQGNAPVLYVKPRGLKPGGFYRETSSGRLYPSDALMEFGFPLPHEAGEYNAYQYEFVLEA